MNEPDQIDACESCTLHHTRRDFLRESVTAAFGVLLTLGATNKAAAVSVSWIEAYHRSNGTITYPIPTADGAQIDHTNEVILVRWQSEVYAFSLSCPHQHTALRWEPENARFQCPRHHSKYQPDGTFISGRATRGMDRFSITRQGNDVVVDINALHKQPDDPAGYHNAVVHLGDS